MKVGILTFHAPHNCGSMLQAYALQNVVAAMGHDCEIINLRTERQRHYYRPFPARMIPTAARYPRAAYGSYLRFCLFERFINENYRLSPVEYRTYGGLEEGAQDYDAYISGSDQIWNVSCYDWDAAYGLGFVRSGRRIAYAPSMGPIPEREVLPRTERLDLLADAIRAYDAVSVREEGTARIVGRLTGTQPPVVLDPTLLLDADGWRGLESGAPIVGGDYILLYTPWENHELFGEAVALGRKFNMKVVVPALQAYGTYRRNPDVVYKIDAGPREFLNLMRHARLVVGASFHAAAFAIIFGRQLYAHKGMEDSRVSSLLGLAGLERFSLLPDTVESPERLEQTYAGVRPRIAAAAGFSRRFLAEALADGQTRG